MEDKNQAQSALITDDGTNWPPLVLIGIVACFVLSAFAYWFHSKPGSDHYQDEVREAIWTTYAVGNPYTYVLLNMRQSLQDPLVVCGRINYEKTLNGGWTGFTDFYMDKGVVYIAPIGGRYEKTFRELCIATPDTSDKPAGPAVIELVLPTKPEVKIK